LVANCPVVIPWATIEKDTPMCTYNLFRHRDKRHLVWAAPTDCTVPDFIAGKAWVTEQNL
jgi:hypothetical protein